MSAFLRVSWQSLLVYICVCARVFPRLNVAHVVMCLQCAVDLGCVLFVICTTHMSTNLISPCFLHVYDIFSISALSHDDAPSRFGGLSVSQSMPALHNATSSSSSSDASRDIKDIDARLQALQSFLKQAKQGAALAAAASSSSTSSSSSASSSASNAAPVALPPSSQAATAAAHASDSSSLSAAADEDEAHLNGQ